MSAPAPALDVNAAFATERASYIQGQYDRRDAIIKADTERAADFAQRVADGKMRDLGNGRYQVTDPSSWDNGEVWTLRQATPDGLRLVLPEHGLDESKGIVAVYSREPMWHSLGQHVPGGITDIDEVMRLGGLDFDVEQRKVRYHAGGSLRAAPGQFVNVRTDTWAPLGVVGKAYTPVQNRAGFEFLQDLVGEYGLIWESAGVLRGGSRVFISTRLPEDVAIDVEGINEIIRPFLIFSNDHSGNSRVLGAVTPWRPICGNTNRFAIRDAHTTWGVRHTKNATQRIEEARTALKLSVGYYDKFAAEETRLAQTSIELDEFDQLIADLWAEKDEPTVRQANATAKRQDALHDAFGIEVNRVGRTAYAAEQAVTAYLDHAAPRRAVGDKLAAARATAVIEGADDDIKAKAHRQLLTLTTR